MFQTSAYNHRLLRALYNLGYNNYHWDARLISKPQKGVATHPTLIVVILVIVFIDLQCKSPWSIIVGLLERFSVGAFSLTQENAIYS